MLLRDLTALRDGSDEDVLRFARKWGPVWSCSVHAGCLWNPTTLRPEAPRTRTSCAWTPEESVTEFRMWGARVAAVLEIYARLQSGEKTRSEDWFLMDDDGGNSRLPPESQRVMLCGAINDYLCAPEGPLFRLRWYDEERARLTIDAGLGFCRVAWMLVAQVIGGAAGVYICSGCAKAYVREKRPGEGRHNCCDDCGKNKKASKKLWARQNRLNNRRQRA